MTLGTLYSGIYDYENSKHNYLEAINEALDANNSHFASVAYYNLSLLEHSFYHFSEALRIEPDNTAAKKNLELCRSLLDQAHREGKQALPRN